MARKSTSPVSLIGREDLTEQLFAWITKAQLFDLFFDSLDGDFDEKVKQIVIAANDRGTYFNKALFDIIGMEKPTADKPTVNGKDEKPAASATDEQPASDGKERFTDDVPTKVVSKAASTVPPKAASRKKTAKKTAAKKTTKKGGAA